MNKNDQEFIIQKIRTQYMDREPNELEELKALDTKVKRPAQVFAYVGGSIGALVMGSGMSLIMTDLGATLGIGDPMLPGVIVGAIGLLAVLLMYPLYKKLLGSRRRKYADRILSLSDRMMRS